MLNKLLTELLIETHGQDYLDLIVKDKRVHEQRIRGQKVESIYRIAEVRKSLGYPLIGVKQFDYLYDKDLYTLSQIQSEYQDLLKEH